ncbi:esterase/lipase [Rheinheimera pacifica]|uniref:alpha/beta hydrolase n=1 Tax=Rheinheimera pacifica TaxID=173990 RepID=UPI002854B9EA|nr:alpha/beta fold hydrolase [Rheinheimera pacifica]MDR6983429.1 esterase/lipase [Rheinheimera pacifica]
MSISINNVKSVSYLLITQQAGRTRLFSLLMLSVLSALSFILLPGCASLEGLSEPVSSVSFYDYQNETRHSMRQKRNFQLPDKEAELLWNAPRQWWPVNQPENVAPKRGILLVHGLGDSPWSFHDVALELAAQGFLVRTILLPGHGTTPYDMLSATAEQWQNVVYEQARALKDDIDGEIFLGGFSTGANLVLEYAYHNPDVSGLVLFSPAFKSTSLDWLAPVIAKVRPWLISPEQGASMQTPLRYLNVPANGFAQFYRTSVTARRLLDRPYHKPVFMVVAEHDSVLNTDYLLDVFQHRFVHSQSRLIWYGAKPDNLTDEKRIFIRSDKLPEERISQFSHMGVLFAPDNPLYGREGSQRICANSNDRAKWLACEQSAQVWFSEWGYNEEGKIHARLTFNPYFDWQNTVMAAVLSSQIEP